MASFKCDPIFDYANDPMVMIRKIGDIKMPSLQNIKMDRHITRHVLCWTAGRQAGRDSKGVQAESGQVDGAHKEGRDLRPVSFLSQMPVQYITSAKSNLFLQGQVLRIQHQVAEAWLTPTSSICLDYKQDSP